MTATAADLGGLNPMKAVRRDAVYLRMSVPIGASGAVGTITSDDPAWALTRASAGVYTGVFPKSAKGEPPTFNLVAAPAVFAYQITAFDPVAGTYGVTFVDAAGAAVEIDSAAVLYISILLDKGT